MTGIAHSTLAPDAAPPAAVPAAATRVLVVDDSRAQRLLLAAGLRQAGFEVFEASDGAEALDIVAREDLRLVLSDWMMPGMSGPELCRALRARDGEAYVYFVLLTSKAERAAIAEGLDSGADDFLTKPVSGDELRARLRAGARILEMQAELTRKNAVIGETLAELQRLYDIIDSDLREARKLQEALVSERHRDFGAGRVSLLLRSAGHVGGDLVGCFRAGTGKVGLYSIDVSGHGITSALMTARLAGHLNTASPEHNIALSHTAGEYYRVRPPEAVVRSFNDLMTTVIETEHYFTLAYAVVDLGTGRVDLTQAGHPHPVVQRADGTVEFHGRGGLPVGLIEGADYERVSLVLRPGDRLLLASDGLTECPDPAGALLDEAGLAAMLRANAGLGDGALLDRLVADLAAHHGSGAFPDDVSAVLFEYAGASPVR